MADNDIIHKGSIIITKMGDITYKAGQDIEISASKNTDAYKSDTKTKKASITIGSTNPAAPAIDSIGGDIGYSDASQQTDSATYNNSGVIAAQGAINITTGANADITGANLHSETIHLNIGNNLFVESKQNQYDSYGNSNSFNIGYNTGGGAAIGGGYGKNDANRLWTDTQTSIIGTNSVNINVDGKIDLTGALIANINNGVDAGNLFIKTESLTYANLQDYDTSQESGFNLNLSDIKTKKDKNNKNYLTGDAQIGIKNKGYQKEQTTKATVGAGSITTDDNIDTTALNRNITETQITTKDQITAALDLKTGLDLRLLSGAGRHEILGELKTAPDNIIDNTWILSGGTKDTILTIAGTFTEFVEASAVGAKIDGGIKEKVTAAKVNITDQYNANIQQIKNSFALRANIAQQTGFFDSIAFLGQEIPIIGNFIPTASTGNFYGNLVIVDTGGIYNNKDRAEDSFEAVNDIMSEEGISYPIIHVPYTEGTVTEVVLEMFAGYKIPGLQWANSVISNPNIKKRDTIILNSHSGGAIKSSIGSNYLIINNIGIIKQFANQAPAFGYFNNINNIIKNYTSGDFVSEGGQIISPLYKSYGEEEIKELLPGDSKKKHYRLDKNILNENIQAIKEMK